MCNGCLSDEFNHGNGSQDSSGTIAATEKFEGPSAETEEFEGMEGKSSPNTTGWGA
jgi:hypothetical protein